MDNEWVVEKNKNYSKMKTIKLFLHFSPTLHTTCTHTAKPVHLQEETISSCLFLTIYILLIEISFHTKTGM